MDKHLVGYIEEALKKNFSEEHIRNHLKKAGFHADDIDMTLLQVYKGLGAVPVHPRVLHTVRALLGHNIPDKEIIKRICSRGIDQHFVEYAIKESKVQNNIIAHKHKRLHLPK
ncbi:hypothetical protein HN419_04000 [Candidatus Woesearchaeota archaeon]|jgi:hypothetical protein|nr:hypothetical protein [Candidatus Woesearchaeota archaeon]MBT3537959.1 hypothetical protein [Candidatus Woesearchaeota archaeon]MBT4697314.1 hypothetical protein [Candidatus Woesearchaeota archaeon]MBT4717034.1 hypothetical protein [Candidatus Woesearchaeota archaeon]MBT7105628.1 hypothetical protein [Candidatus Woesearchaeota archaeon]